MPQLVTRIDDDLASQIDQLVTDGVVESRSDAVRRGLTVLLDRHRRSQLARAIIEGYAAKPQTDDDVGWADAATVAMIAEEPW